MAPGNWWPCQGARHVPLARWRAPQAPALSRVVFLVPTRSNATSWKQSAETQLTLDQSIYEIFHWDLVINLKNVQTDTQQHLFPNIFITMEGRHDQIEHLLGPPSAPSCQQLRGCQAKGRTPHRGNSCRCRTTSHFWYIRLPLLLYTLFVRCWSKTAGNPIY